jgi:hypothetical protein
VGFPFGSVVCGLGFVWWFCLVILFDLLCLLGLWRRLWREVFSFLITFSSPSLHAQGAFLFLFSFLGSPIHPGIAVNALVQIN